MGALFCVFKTNMISSLLGTKSHMEQAFTIVGHRVPVTVVKTGINTITQVKTKELDGYSALQLGFGTRKTKHTSKALQGHFKKAKQEQYPRYLKEIRTDETIESGTKLSPSQVLKEGDLVSITGVSKGKGFAGVVKRWGFAGGPKTHGQSDRHRAPGSIGQGTDPGRVHKGKKMGGRMGGEQKTVQNITVLKVDDKQRVVWLSGPVPGVPGVLLEIKKMGENKKFQQLYSENISEEVVEQAMEKEAAQEDANRPQVEEDTAIGAESSSLLGEEKEKKGEIQG